MMETEGRCYIIGGWPTVITPEQIPMGGGGADVEEAAFCRAALLGALRHVGMGAYHKSVLTVRMAPERSTVYVDL